MSTKRWREAQAKKRTCALSEMKSLAKLGVGVDVLEDIFGPYGHYARDVVRDAQRPPVPPRLRRFVLSRDGHRCVQCGATTQLEIDHIWPVTKGGPSLEYNLQVLCKTCNGRKRHSVYAGGA